MKMLKVPFLAIEKNGAQLSDAHAWLGKKEIKTHILYQGFPNIYLLLLPYLNCFLCLIVHFIQNINFNI
jgi:hypothetical protein